MKKCNSCGYDNLDEAKFCNNCGNELIIETSENKDNDLLTNNKYLDIVDDSIIEEPKKQKPKFVLKKKHKILIIVLASIIVLAFVINAILLKVTLYAVQESINLALNEKVTSESYDELFDTYSLYNSLNDKHKEKIDNYDEFLMQISECLQLREIDEFDSLFNKGEYQEALDVFDSPDEDCDSYETVCRKVYNGAVNLFNNKEYDISKKYFEKFDPEHENCEDYIYIIELNEKIENEEDINYLEAVSTLKGYSDDGFETASQLLKQKPFSNYIELVNHRGFYKSDKTFIHRDKLFKYEECTYIYLSDELWSTAYWTDTIKNITASDVKDKAEKNDFSCDCAYTGNGKYHCCVHYKDFITQDNWTYSFDLSFKNDKIVISSLKTSEDESSQTFVDGTYSLVGQ